ncbi:shikimate dehydrogenase [Georgenia yuyongxinii]|uniref:Shikimate dehydrogenase n=1 Tax=Georgenia yuyongxinii TaxID=2589797 RepID=A0A552WJT5_9MICO|nr:shikimate dehydrogenase [Georgenia yuyongxinii]TRW43021.1 shikimate dehydrogenase [Georgenia yuyongxinii]
MSRVHGVLGGQDLSAPGVERRAAVLGHPVAHSLSPALHRSAYAQLGLDTTWAYGLQDVTAAELPGVVEHLDGTWAGLSLTMPLKQAVLTLLDVVDPLADVTGAVNTLVVQPARAGTGLLVGFNTDVHGIVATVREAAPPGWRPQRGVILGARATASSALAALGELGCTSPTLVARSFAGPGSAAAAAHKMGLTTTNLPWSTAEDVAAVLRDADLVISTVPAGVADPVAAALTALVAGETRPEGLTDKVLLDVVYEPWPSPLVRAWSEAGGTVAPGWGMLLHQAEAQVRLMTGRVPDVEAMRTGLLAELARRAAGGAVPTPPPPFDLPQR